MTSFLQARILPVQSQSLFWGLIALLAITTPLVLKTVLIFIVFPFKQWRKPMLTVEPQWKPTQAETLTPEMLDFLAPLVPQFKAEGFEIVTNLEMQNSVPGVIGFQLFLINRKLQETASIILTQASLLRNHVFSFSARFMDGTEIRTGMNRDIGCFPKDPKVDSMSVGWDIDVRQLFEFHRRRVQHLGRERDRRTLPVPGQEIAFLTEKWHEEGSRLAGAGYCYLDSAVGAYRRTFKGSYIMCCRLIPRIKRWRIRRRDRQTRRMWRKVEMDQWTARQPRPSGNSAATQPSYEAGVAIEHKSDPLQYELDLEPGEIRSEPTSDGVIIRMGRQSIRGYLRANIGSLIFAAIYIVLIGHFLLNAWLLHQMAPYLPMKIYFFGQLKWLALLIAIFGLQLFRFFRGTAFTGGVVVLTATPTGLRFSNVPSRPSQGNIARQDLRGLHVVLALNDTFQRSYRLTATHRSGRQILLVGRHRQDLLETRQSIAQAIGISLGTSETSQSVP